MKSFETRCINEEILGKLSLKNRYAFLNANFMALLDDQQKSLLEKVEKFCLKMEKTVDHAKDDIYNWIPAFGEQGYVTRSREFKELALPNWDYYGLTADLMRAIAVDAFDPQFNMAMGASVLAINPFAEHHENKPERLEALKEMVTGKAVGSILITEPEVGSDAVHPMTIGQKTDKGVLVNGTKIYNTNAPKSKYAVLYTTTESRKAEGMMQLYTTLPKEGCTIERVNIPWVPKIFLGKETFKDCLIPNENIMAQEGKGRDHLFEGLVPERMGIAMLNVAEMWNAVTHAAIYCNLREQMGEVILKHQGVGFLLCDLWAKTMNFTMGCLKFCENFDSALKKYNGVLPKPLAMALVPGASQMKYEAAMLAERISYEAANLMGGAGVCDNTLMQELLGVSRIQEVIGGTRQIQQYVMSMSLRSLFKMAI
jgi:alkylation response protein AidB-like acyl-CoA dehydrogenase